jgi:hypothetical protein
MEMKTNSLSFCQGNPSALLPELIAQFFCVDKLWFFSFESLKDFWFFYSFFFDICILFRFDIASDPLLIVTRAQQMGPEERFMFRRI